MESKTTDRETLVTRTEQAGAQEMRPETFGRFDLRCVFNKLGYETLKLDTLPQMFAAQRMYEKLGFRDTAPYNDNPVSGVRFLALDLRVANRPPAGR